VFHAQQQIGPYTLMRMLGQGGFGQVWLAEKRGSLLTPQVALKLPLDPDPDLTAVQQEARLWLQASGHPNVLPVLDAEVYNGQVVIVSEYAAGGSLSSWLKQNGGKAPSVDEAVAMISGILAGLEYLHALTPQPIIHRDLKPDNILLQGGQPRLTDFGISRVLKTTAQTQHASGTPHYMPPEAFRGRYAAQSDVWAAGVILYQMLCGRLPFPQTDIPSLYGAILTDAPPPLPADVPQTIRTVVTKALSKEPTERFASAAEMQAGLRRLPTSPLQQNPTTPALPDWIARSERMKPRIGEDALDNWLLPRIAGASALGGAVCAWRYLAGGGLFFQVLCALAAFIPSWLVGVFVSLTLGSVLNFLRGISPHRTLAGHILGVRTVAISADDQRIVTGSVDKTAKVWDAATGQTLFTLQGHPHSLLAVAISADNMRITTCSEDGMVQVWSADTGTLLHTLQGYCDEVGAVALSSDGKRMAAVRKDSHGGAPAADVWDIDTGQLCLRLTGHSRDVSAVAISSDNQRIVTGSSDRTAKVWDAATGQELLTLQGHNAGIVGVAISADGRRIVTRTMDEVKVWDPATGLELWKKKPHNPSVSSIAISDDGSIVVTTGEDTTAKVWDVAANTKLLTLKGHSSGVNAAVLSSDGRCVVTASSDKTAKLWVLPRFSRS
jgi:WD40 repeat protein